MKELHQPYRDILYLSVEDRVDFVEGLLKVKELENKAINGDKIE